MRKIEGKSERSPDPEQMDMNVQSLRSAEIEPQNHYPDYTLKDRNRMDEEIKMYEAKNQTLPDNLAHYKNLRDNYLKN